jgi:hypothetical protein
MYTLLAAFFPANVRDEELDCRMGTLEEPARRRL